MRVWLDGRLGVGLSFALALTLLGCGDAGSESGEAGAKGEAPTSAYPIALEEGSTGTVLVNIADLGPQKVEYVVKQGVPIHSGDIIVSPEELSGLADPRTTSAGRRNENYKWPLARVPWEVDPAIAVTDPLYQRIINGLEAWRVNNGGTPLTFPVHTPGSGGDYVYFTNDLGTGSGGWSSAIGRFGGKQTVRLGQTTTDDVIRHEIGHVLGLYHEQQRADRNSYLKVYDGTNGLPDRFACGTAAGKGNFLRYVDSAVGEYGNDGVDVAGALDFNSIMLYGAPGNDCCGGLACMTNLAGGTFPTPTAISRKDTQGINRIYLRFTNRATFGTQTQFRDMAVSSWGGSRADALAVRQSDRHVMHSVYNGSTWSGFNEDMGGNSTLVSGRISSVSWGPGRIDWVSISSAGSVTHGWWNQGSGPGGVEDFGSAGCPGASGVTISSRGVGMLDIFAVCGPSKVILRKSYNAGWTGWTATNGETGFSGILDAVSWGPSRVDIAAMTNTNPPQLKHIWWNASGPFYIETLSPSIPDTLVGTPVSISSWGLGRLDIFFNGSNSTAYRMSYEGGWGGAMPVGASNAVIGDAVGRMNGNQAFIDYVFFDNLSGGNFKHAQAYR